MGTFSRFNLRQMSQMYGFNTLVETGTMRGHGISHALNCGLDKIHSIEINPELYLSSRVAFADQQNVFIHLGDSRYILDPILDFIGSEKSVFFWLDAHFSYNYSGFVSYESSMVKNGQESDDKRRSIPVPLVTELSLIFKKRPHNNDVILIDDLCVLCDDPRIPDQGTSTEMLKKEGILKDGMSKRELFDISLEDIESLVPYNFQCQKIYLDQGFLLITRK